MTDWALLPKTELHLHLEGAAPPAFIQRLAGEQKVNLEGAFDAAGDYAWADFTQFLRVYEAACAVLCGPEEYYRLVKTVLEEQSRHGVIYTEHFLAPLFMGGGDPVAWDDYLAAVTEGAAEAERDHAITCRFTATAVRHEGPKAARAVAELTARTMGGRLTGFGLAGDERHLMPADFAMAFAAAAEAGLGLTAHAGEICGAEMIAATLDALPVTRIGHGVRAIEDTAVIDRLLEREITLEVNPGSNIALGIFPDWPSHSIAPLRDAGLRITVSTDDPPYFRTTMTREYQELAAAFGWTAPDFAALNRTAMEAAFCDEASRARLLKSFDAA